MKVLKFDIKELSKQKFVEDKAMPDYRNHPGIVKKNEEARALLAEVGLPDFEKLRKK